jgi:26S proteasome regulatory subunit N9
MRMMSLGLVRGVIDEVAQTVNISWVKPRVLQMQQLQLVQQRLTTWASTVNDTLKFMEGHAKELTV